MQRIKFLVTDECGRLTRWLRLVGCDTASMDACPLSALYMRAYNEERSIVTRNRGVCVSHLFSVIHLRSAVLEEQLKQLMDRGLLAIEEDRIFTRCDQCNCELKPIEKAKIIDQVPPYVFRTQKDFTTCHMCGRIYWSATHWHRVSRVFDRLRSEASHA